MTADREGEGAAGDLSDRIAAARAELEPKPSRNFAEKYDSASLAWRMTIELVVGCCLGFGIGWNIDAATGLAPVFLILFGLLGFAAGVRTVIGTAKEASERSAPPPRVDQGRAGRAEPRDEGVRSG